jgi:hypothetical protein
MLMRFRIGEDSFGFWCSPTTHGISMGPIIPGEEHVHLTFFVNGEVVNAHLKIIEKGKTGYKNLTTMTTNQFQHRIQQITSTFNSLRPINPDVDTMLITEHGKKMFQKLIGGSLTLTYKGRKQYLDFDFGVILDELQDFTEETFNYISVGKAQDLTSDDSLQFGITLDGEPVFPIKDKVYSWGIKTSDIHNDSEGPFEFLRRSPLGKMTHDLMSIIGVPQLFSEIQQRKLFERR